jgi:peptide deformylase
MSKTRGLTSTLELAQWTIANLPIRYFGDPILRARCVAFESAEFGQPEMEQLARQLTSTLDEYRAHTGMGRGLAANQIGSNRRMILLWLDEPLIMINPNPIELHGQGSGWESCISSGAMLIGQAILPWIGTFEYFSPDGSRKELVASPMQTRLALHEIDHLDGGICIERYQTGTTRFITGGKAEVLGYELKQLNS